MRPWDLSLHKLWLISFANSNKLLIPLKTFRGNRRKIVYKLDDRQSKQQHSRVLTKNFAKLLIKQLPWNKLTLHPKQATQTTKSNFRVTRLKGEKRGWYYEEGGGGMVLCHWYRAREEKVTFLITTSFLIQSWNYELKSFFLQKINNF